MGSARKRIIVGLIIFFIIAVGLFVVNIEKDRQFSDQDILNPTTNNSPSDITVNGTQNLSRTGLSNVQALKVKAVLSDFLTTLDSTNTITIDSGSIQNSYDSSNKYYIYSFTANTDLRVSYIIKVIYVSDDDTIIKVYDSNANEVYEAHKDG